MDTINKNEIFQFSEFMETVLIGRQLLGEKFHLKLEFEIEDEDRGKKMQVDCNENRVMMKLILRVNDDNKKLINRLKYYLKNCKKDTFWNRASKVFSNQEFTFTFTTYNEFVEFYNKYLI